MLTFPWRTLFQVPSTVNVAFFMPNGSPQQCFGENIFFSQVAICGSDIALYEWNEVAKVIATVPFIPGKFNHSLFVFQGDIGDP